LADSRTINKVEYDYNNDGTWTTLDTHTYNTKDTYTINVKVTDSEGEFSTTSATITIVELPFSDMTDEQKLKKAIDPAYYDEIIALINAEKNVSSTSGIATGKQYVQDNPAEFGLVTKSSHKVVVVIPF